MHEIERGISLLSEAAKKLSILAGLNCLTLNAMKTKAIVFGSSHNIRLFKSLNIPSIAINNVGKQVQFGDEVVSLGIVLDSTLSWTSLRTRLQRLSNACVRFIFGVRRDTHITPYRHQLE